MAIVFFIVTIIVLLMFTAGLLQARHYTEKNRPGDMPAFSAYFVSSANAILVANLGALLGIEITLGVSQLASAASQLIAAGWYALCLLLVFVYWARKGFEEEKDKIVSVIPELGRSAAGILLALLSAGLGVAVALA